MAPFPIFQPNASNTPLSSDTPVALKGKTGSLWLLPGINRHYRKMESQSWEGLSRALGKYTASWAPPADTRIRWATGGA